MVAAGYPSSSVIARSRRRRGNLQYRRKKISAWVNIENLKFTMLIGLLRYRPSLLEIPTAASRPRNDILAASLNRISASYPISLGRVNDPPLHIGMVNDRFAV